MDEKWIEMIYDSLQGNLIVPVPGVRNVFAPGSECEKCYADMLEAYARLCRRLGKVDEDEDVEVILKEPLNKSPAASSGSFAPAFPYKNLEIHTVFLRFLTKNLEQNLSLPALADLIRASLTPC